MSVTSFATQEEFDQYLKELRMKYHFSCFREKDAEACHRIGDWYSAHKMYNEALEQYGMTCDTYKHRRSCFKYGIALLGLQAKTKPDKEKALKYTQLACDLGDPEACLASASLFQEKGETQNLQQAAKFFERYCDAKHTFSGNGCFEACSIHIKGDGVPQDFKKAFQCAMKGCEMDNFPSCVNVSVMYRNGDGVEKNMELAELYAQKAKEIRKTLPSDPAQGTG